MTSTMIGGIEMPNLPKKRKHMAFGQWFDKNLDEMANLLCSFYNIARDERWISKEELESYVMLKVCSIIGKFIDNKNKQLIQEISDATDENETDEVADLLEGKMRLGILHKSFHNTLEPMISTWRHSVEQDMKEKDELNKKYSEQLRLNLKGCPLVTARREDFDKN